MHSSPPNDRRRYPRRAVRGGISVELRVEVSGVKPAILLTRGMVADISCGGIKCDIDLDVPVGTRVDVRFPELPDNTLALDLVDGRVVRTESLGGVPDQMAIAFARPLENLDVEQLGAPADPAQVVGRDAAARRNDWSDSSGPFPTLAADSFL